MGKGVGKILFIILIQGQKEAETQLLCSQSLSYNCTSIMGEHRLSLLCQVEERLDNDHSVPSFWHRFQSIADAQVVLAELK